MGAVAVKQSSNDTTRKHKVKEQIPGTAGASVFSSHDIAIQRKPSCPCGGGCPRCRGVIQPKLTINKPGDIYEQEADRMAEQVMATSGHPAASNVPLRIQRLAVSSSWQADSAPASVDHALVSPGMPLEPTLRHDMEQRLEHDFSQVRVHSDAAAEQSAREVDANAYTVGRDIVFGAGRFAPRTHEGRRLIAHELTHVVQQTELHMPCLQRQYFPSIFQKGTNYRFDTFKITESDLSDPEITARLQGLSKDQLHHYLARVTDQAVRDYIFNLFAAPEQQALQPPPQKPAPSALDCDKKPLVESWGQDTCCSRMGFTDDEAVNKKTGEKMSSCNKWPLFLALHAKEHGLEGVASCKPSKLGQKAQIKVDGNTLTVGCIDTRTKENNVIEIDAEAAGVFFGSKQLSEHADEVCYGGSFDFCEFNTTCREFPKETWCLPIGVTKAETTDSPAKHGWAKR